MYKYSLQIVVQSHLKETQYGEIYHETIKYGENRKNRLYSVFIPLNLNIILWIMSNSLKINRLFLIEEEEEDFKYQYTVFK